MPVVCGGAWARSPERPAVIACDCHFNVMVRNTSQLFVGGPPVVKASRGLDISKEELGGEQIHVYETGVVQNLAESEADAMQQARRFLSYLPQNVWEAPPRLPPEDDPERREEELLSLIPRNSRRIYNPRRAAGTGARPRLVLRNPARVGPRADHRPGARRRLSGRRDDQQPEPERRLHRQADLREGHADDPALRHVPPATGLLLRRAGLLRGARPTSARGLSAPAPG